MIEVGKVKRWRVLRMVGWHNDIFVEGNENWARTRLLEARMGL